MMKRHTGLVLGLFLNKLKPAVLSQGFRLLSGIAVVSSLTTRFIRATERGNRYCTTSRFVSTDVRFCAV